MNLTCLHRLSPATRILQRLCSLLALAALLASAAPAHAQFWDKLIKPQITVRMIHPPRLGLNIRKVAVGPAWGPCTNEILQQLTSTLLSSQVEVIDYNAFNSILASRHMNFNGYLDTQSAMQMGQAIGPAALILVKVSRCEVNYDRRYTERKVDPSDEDKRNGYNRPRIIRTEYARTEFHLRGTLQTVDLSTGRIFTASPIAQDSMLENRADDRRPEFPPVEAVRDPALTRAAYEASTMFVQWSEDRKLYFYNEKDCNLKAAYEMVKNGDFPGALNASLANVETCKTWPGVKDSNMNHANYNVGMAYLLVNDYNRALQYLNEAARIKSGDIVTETINETRHAMQLEAEMRQTADRTERYEQSQAQQAQQQQQQQQQQYQQQQLQPPPAQPAPAASGKSPASVKERLQHLDELYRNGLITNKEYNEKKQQILNDL